MKSLCTLAAACLLFACQPSHDNSLPAAANVSFTTDYNTPAFADDNRLEKVKSALPLIDQIFKNHFEKEHFPGLSYGIVLDGKLIHSSSFGVSDVKMMTQANAKTGFRIASMTKSFTAMAIMRLRDEGKLRISDPVSKYIPEVADIKYLTQDSQPLTIEHLMTMGAGFPEDNPWGDRQLADTDEELITLIKNGLTFSNAPGLEYEYSNLGFGMLGYIISKVSGKPYQLYISENIIKPLGMSDTRWEYTEVPKEQLALGYRWEDEQFKEEPILHDGIFGAMGGLICSVEDFSKYIQFHLSAWPPRNDDESPIIRRSSVREMHQLQRLNNVFAGNASAGGKSCAFVSGYGYGLGYRRDCNNVLTVRHGGGLPGFGSEWRILPDYGIGIVSLSNLTYGGLGLPNSLALDTLIKLADLKPRMLPVSAILQQRQKEIVEVLAGWPEDKLSIFADNFFLDYSRESRKKQTDKILQETGAIVKSRTLVPENQLRGTFIIECEKKNVKCFFTLTPENPSLVQQLDLEIINK